MSFLKSWRGRLQERKLHGQDRQHSADNNDSDDTSTSQTVQSPPPQHSTSSSYPTSELLLPQTKTTSGTSFTRSRRRKKDDPIGLHVLHNPQNEHTVDIIFVHGLGGSSQLSWSWGNDLAYFWPKEWLPQEPELRNARIITFGYDAFFTSLARDMFDIPAFAQQLLVQLKFGTDANETLNIGKVPIMFVVHSMGGLVVKEAFTKGLNDPHYRSIIHNVQCIIFLGTPHYGSGLAEILEKFLKVTFQSKKYVSDLKKSSARIKDINELFRNQAPRIEIVSFFEMLPSGFSNIIVVPKDSATLGYRNEIRIPLKADHHNVIKYKSRQDANYTLVRNIIRSMAQKIRQPSHFQRWRTVSPTRSQSSLRNALEAALNISEPSADLEQHYEYYVRGSSNWILQESEVEQWIKSEAPGPVVLHITGPAGSGKSVMASFLIRHLEDSGISSQYFFFRYNEQTKRSLKYCLLSLAFQMGTAYPEYGRRLRSLLEERQSIIKSEHRVLWKKAFLDLFAKISPPDRVYWVIDALDESESADHFLNLLLNDQIKDFPLRIIFLTRPHITGRSFDKIKVSDSPVTFLSVSIATPEHSLELFISKELQLTKWFSEPFMRSITEALLKKCRGNFLWLRLVLRELKDCDYRHEVEQTLEDTPDELVKVYERIQAQLVKDMPRPEHRQRAIRILSWLVCVERQFSLDELSDALSEQHGSDPMLDLKKTIDRLCGDLVVVDTDNHVSMTHHTAREFLVNHVEIPLHINMIQAHTMLLERCFQVLTDPKLRIRVKMEGYHGFLGYACTSWSHHLAESDAGMHNSVQVLTSFLQSNAVLNWINAVCQLGNLRILISTAKNMNAFRGKLRRFDNQQSPTLSPLDATETIGLWATELVRLVGRFGFHILKHPSSIYNLVPSLCPPESVISQQFYAKSNKPALRVSGLGNPGWDDSLASFSVGHDGEPSMMIYCMESHFAIHSSLDTVTLFHAPVFQEVRKFCHEEVIVALSFSQDGDKLVTCGSRTVKIWDVLSGRQLEVYNNPAKGRAVAVTLVRDATQVCLCCTDGRLRSQVLSSQEDWKTIHREVPSDGSLGSSNGTPCATAFSPDGTKIAIAFRGKSMGLWSTDAGRLIAKCHTPNSGSLSGSEFGPYPRRLTWNPIHEHVIGLYNDSKLFKWNPVDDHSEELEGAFVAHEVACSPDGRFVVTASGEGSLRVWQYDTFSLVYQLSCASPVTDIAVSPDGKRIYDLRGSFCNVWEPNLLIRLAEADEGASETASFHAESANTSLNSEYVAAIREPVAAIAFASPASTGGQAYCFTTDDGKLSMKIAPDEDFIVVQSGYFGATHLSFSNNGQLLACAEIDGDVAVKSIAAAGPRASAVGLPDIRRVRPDNPAQQLLFNASGTKLLVRCTKQLTMWSLTDARDSKPITRHLGDEHFHVAMHPFADEVALSITASSVTALSISDLAPIRQWQLDLTDVVNDTTRDVAPIMSRRQSANCPSNPGSTGGGLVDRVMVCPNKAIILVQVTMSTLLGPSQTQAQNRRRLAFFMLDTSTLGLSDSDSATSVLEVAALPAGLLSRIEIPLGFVSNDAAATAAAHNTRWAAGTMTGRANNGRYSMAFLDQDLWVCTWSLDDVRAERIRRHFFLPRDWINMDCLEMAAMTPDGRFLCPRNGEVAVVAGGLGKAWMD